MATGQHVDPEVRVDLNIIRRTEDVSHHVSYLSVSQDSGQHLSVIDDCNDHMLTVWDWQKKSKIAEIKVSVQM